MEPNEEGFGFSYAGTVFAIRGLGADRYLFIAQICPEAKSWLERRESVECTGETLAKAVALAKQCVQEILKAPVEYDRVPQDSHVPPYPCVELLYSLNGEVFSLHGDGEDDLAKVTVTSPAFPAVMTLLHKLAVLFREAQDEAERQKEPETEKLHFKVLCPFCGKPIRPRPNFCSACGKSLADFDEFTLSEEMIDPNETLWFCKHCGSFASWTDTYCRICGERLK